MEDNYWPEMFAKWRAEAEAKGLPGFSDEELDSLARGLQDEAEGRVKDLGSFEQYAEDEDE